MTDFKELAKPLSVAEIDFRIQSINKGGYATILAYKNARVDINRLNKHCTPLGWKREHVNGNHNCIVSLWDSENKHWVSKEDTGTESNTEAAKGLASDSFKRACFNWGIGIELYDMPLISVKLNANEFDLSGPRPKQTWNLKLKEWVWRIDYIGSELTYIAARDQSGETRFYWGSAAEKAVHENLKSVECIVRWLSDGKIEEAAEAWFEIDANAKRNMYVSEKHGGPFSPQERDIMQKEFRQYYHGEKWDGLFSK